MKPSGMELLNGEMSARSVRWALHFNLGNGGVPWCLCLLCLRAHEDGVPFGASSENIYHNDAGTHRHHL